VLSQTILKKSKGGTYYVEIDSKLVKELELHVGDRLQLYTEEVWIYNKSSKVCTLRGISAEHYDALIGLLNGIESKNLAKNQEDI